MHIFMFASILLHLYVFSCRLIYVIAIIKPSQEHQCDKNREGKRERLFIGLLEGQAYSSPLSHTAGLSD